ncbi:MAG: enoyl-CoA hydratase/isomerase family protein [Candidatus Binataceae bacterium]|nr:enoyl-CoA hydratase/isomerase family protein [Candidatus Binataceae bacterium]
MAEFKFLKYEKRDHIAWITLNRPEVMNAMHPPASVEGEQIWNDFVADKDMWVAILTGAGERAFSAGNDLKYTAEHGMGPFPKGGFLGLTARYDIDKPIIAAVNGFAMGGGFELALACDVIIAAEHARLGLPEPRVGLAAGAGGVHRLPRQVPLKIAMGMMLTAKPITAAEAHRWGVVNEVVPGKDLLAAAQRWAGEMMEGSPLALRATKSMAMAGLGRPVEEALGHKYEIMERLMKSKDAVEGPRAFSEKRKPNWTGE